MRLALLILTTLLVGCLTSTMVKHEVKMVETSQDIDKKIEELKKEQKKLEELQKNIDKQIHEAIKINPTGSGSIPQVSSSAPSQIPKSIPAPITSIPRFESDRFGSSSTASSAPPRSTSIDPVGSGSPPIITSLPNLSRMAKNTPDNLTVAEQLYKANAVFAVPDKANIKEDIKAQLIIDPTKTVEEIKKDITVGPVRESGQIKISKIVIAKLNAPDFEIISAPAIAQAIIEDGKTEWIWGLRPKTAGIHPINLVIEAEVTVGNKMTPHLIRTFDKQVMIEITATQTLASWWNKYWQWIIATLLLPFGKWLYSQHKSKKDSD